MQTHFEFSFLEEATETLRAIAHPIRIAIIDLLRKSERLSVTELHTSLNIEQATTSHHLRILKNKNVVKVDREGKNSFYSLAAPYFHDIIVLLDKGIESSS